ncbi:hypothetical protein GCM10009127_10320 [Alteraurantiacibacter aestuarii]
MKKAIAFTAGIALAASCNIAMPVSVHAAGNDDVALCRVLVDSELYSSLGECMSIVRTAPPVVCKSLKEAGYLTLFGWRNLGDCVSDLRSLN